MKHTLPASTDAATRELIRFPVLTAEQFDEVAAPVYEAINACNDHALQGWEECGFVAPHDQIAE